MKKFYFNFCLIFLGTGILSQTLMIPSVSAHLATKAAPFHDSTVGLEMMMHFKRRIVNAVVPIQNLDHLIQVRLGIHEPGEAWILNSDRTQTLSRDLSNNGPIYKAVNDVKRWSIGDLDEQGNAASMIEHRVYYHHPALDRFLQLQGLLEEGEMATWACNQELSGRAYHPIETTNVELSTPIIVLKRNGQPASGLMLKEFTEQALLETGKENQGYMSYAYSPMHIHVGIPAEIRKNPQTLGLFLGRLIVLTEEWSGPLNERFRAQERVVLRGALTWEERVNEFRKDFNSIIHSSESAEDIQLIQFLDKKIATIKERPEYQQLFADVKSLYDVQSNDQLQALIQFSSQPENRPRVNQSDLFKYFKDRNHMVSLQNRIIELNRDAWIRKHAKGLYAWAKEILGNHQLSDAQKGTQLLELIKDFYHNKHSPLQARDDYRRQALNLAYIVKKTRSNREGAQPPPTVEFRFFPTDPDSQNSNWEIILANLLVGMAKSGQEIPGGNFKDLVHLIELKLGSAAAQDFTNRFENPISERKKEQERFWIH